MKRISFGSEQLVTGDAVADALLTFAATLTGTRAGVAVEIPVLEENGAVARHTLLLTPSTSLGVNELDGTAPDEKERFPVPELPAVSVSMMPVADADAAATMPSDEERGIGAP